MTEQNLVKGDIVYPQYQTTDQIPIQGNATPLVFVKGELATITAGFLTKLTTTKIRGLVQVKNLVTGGLAGDDTITANVLRTRSRVLLSLPVAAKAGDLVQINGADGTGNVVVSVALVDTANLAIGRIFELYRNTAIVASAADLGVVDMGSF